MIAALLTQMTSEEIYNCFAKTFGDHPYIDTLQSTGDIINQDADSMVENGTLVRKKNKFEVREVKVEMIIKDSEASMSEGDLNKYFFFPAAEWLREQLQGRQVVAIYDIPKCEGLTTFNVKGLQMLSKYDGPGQGTKLTFRVFAATPLS